MADRQISDTSFILQSGLILGEYGITDLDAQRVVVRRTTFSGQAFLWLGIAGLAGAVYFTWPLLRSGHVPLSLTAIGKGTEACLLWAAVGFWLAASEYGIRFTFHRDPGTVTIRRWFIPRQIDVRSLRAVELAVGHKGPVEVLSLRLLPSDGSEPVGLFFTPAKEAAIGMAALAQHVAAMLRLPVERSGAPIHSGPIVEHALERLGPQGNAGDGQDIQINCPKCKARNAAAVWYEEVQSYHGVIRQKITWVKCMSCGKALLSKVRGEELTGRTPEELERVISWHVSFVARSMAVIALILAILPVVGLCMALIAVASNWRRKTWAKTVSLIALAISLFMSGWMVLALILNSR